MDKDTYSYFLELLKEKMDNYEKDDLFSFFNNDNDNFSFFIALNYFAIIKDFIIEKDVRQSDVNRRLTLKLLESSLEVFMNENYKYINNLESQNENYKYIIDTIRDSLLHNGYNIDIENKIIHINNNLKMFSCDISFDFFTNFLDFGFYGARIYKERNFIIPVSNPKLYEKIIDNVYLKDNNYNELKRKRISNFRYSDFLKCLDIKISIKNIEFEKIKDFYDILDIINTFPNSSNVRDKVYELVSKAEEDEKDEALYSRIINYLNDYKKTQLTSYNSWDLKSNINDVINNKSKEEFFNNIEANDTEEEIMNKFIKNLNNYFKTNKYYEGYNIEIKKTSNIKKKLDYIVKTKLYDKDMLEDNNYERLFSRINDFFLRKVFDTQENLLMCMHDLNTSLKIYKEQKLKESNKDNHEVSKAILEGREIEKTIRDIRKKNNDFKKTEYDNKILKINPYSIDIRSYKKDYKKTKELSIRLDKLRIMRDQEYKNNILIIESKDENTVLNILKNHNLENYEISLSDLKKYSPKLYEKYNKKFFENNVISEYDDKIHYDIYNVDLIRWSDTIYRRLHFYDNTNPLMFLYLIGCGLYSMNKDKLQNIDNINIDNIKSYSKSSYNQFYNLVLVHGPNKKIELQNRIDSLNTQYNNCKSESGRIKINEMKCRIEKELKELDVLLNKEVKNIDGEKYLEDDKENTLRIIRNCFSHLGRVEIEKLDTLDIKLMDHNENNECVAIVVCNIKDLINIFYKFEVNPEKNRTII